MTVGLQNKQPVSVSPAVLRRAGLRSGQEIEITVSGGVITIRPKLPPADDEYTTAQRSAIDRGIAASEKDYKGGRSYGPFQTHAEFVASLHKESAKLARTKRKALDKQSEFLLQDLQHPSLHAWKYDEYCGQWQARANYAWRFYFKIVGDIYLMDENQPCPK